MRCKGFDVSFKHVFFYSEITCYKHHVGINKIGKLELNAQPLEPESDVQRSGPPCRHSRIVGKYFKIFIKRGYVDHICLLTKWLSIGYLRCVILFAESTVSVKRI